MLLHRLPPLAARAAPSLSALMQKWPVHAAPVAQANESTRRTRQATEASRIQTGCSSEARMNAVRLPR